MAFERVNGIMVFYPTMEEFQDFYKFVTYMESQGAHKMGVAKIVPPKEWSPRANFSNLNNFKITTPIQQYVNGAQGVYQQYNIQKKGLTFEKFKELAESSQYCPPKAKDYDELERKYWKNITYHQPLYGADIPGSLYDPEVKEWNINHLESILDTVQGEYGIKIPGVNTAYLYFGMWKTSFAWHTEDMDLYSINYLHFGEPKLWYAIPPEHGQRLERLARGFFPDIYDQCPCFLRHKMTVISPTVLRQYSIPVNKVIQERGHFIITFPFGYHSGFNLGLNCAESTNFALERWVEFGKKATRCLCRSDGVHINMDMFVKKYQPDQWESYYQQKYCAKPPGESTSDSILSCPGHRRMSQGPIIPTEALAITKPKRRRVEDPQKSAHHYVSSWAESLDGLWQWQYWDFPLEQAFNSLVSKEGSQCCVCTLLAPDDVFKPLDRNKLMKLYKKYQKQKAKRTVLANSSSVVCQSLRIAVKRELIHLPLRKDGTKINIKNIITDKKCCSSSSDSSSDSPVSSLPVSIPHSTSSADVTPIVKVDESDQQDILDEQVLPDSTTTIPLCIPPAMSPSSSAPSPDTTVITDDCKSPNGCFGDVSTTTANQDLLATPPRAHFSSSPDHKRIRRSPRNLSIHPTQHVISLKPGSCDPDELGSEILTCALCKICVHKSCYGVTSPTPDQWLCARCSNNVLEAECCLCALRGGALKPTTDNRWAHIVCVVTLPEVSFGNPVAREPVIIDKIPAARKKLKCHYCETAMEGMTRHKGLCIQCCRARCYLPFHVTCAQYQGLSPPALEGLFGLLCHKHDPESRQTKTVKLIDGEFSKGESVIARINNKYSSAIVEAVEEELFYEVLFDQDCTVCYNLPPCDLLTKDVQKGSSVQVKWSDDKVYAAKLLGWHTSLTYQVKFNDGSTSVVSEEDVYSSIEKLPKKVKSKLVTL